MSFQSRRNFVGLVTATSELGAADGACRTADNVVIRRQGVFEPRDGYRPVPLTYSVTGKAFLGAFVLQGAALYVARQSSALQLLSGDGSGSLLSTFAPVRNDSLSGVVARDVLYLATFAGLQRIPTSATFASGVGLEPPKVTALAFTGSGGPIAAGQKVAYRLVRVRTESGGLVTRSSPTPPITIQNNTAGTQEPVLSFTASATSTGETTVEVYRTRQFPVAITIDDEMQLVGTVSVIAGTTLYTFRDRTADAERTTTLYTSPSRGGIEAQNALPPRAAQLGLFRGSLFLGDTTSLYRLSFSHRWTENLTTVEGVGSRQITGAATTSGSNVVTFTGGGVGLERGMMLRASAGPFPAGAFITTIGAGTFTTSVNASSTTSGQTFTLDDAVQVDGTWYRLGPSGTLGLTYGGTLDWPAVPVAGYAASYTLTSSTPSVLRATHGGEFLPQLPRFDETQTALGTAKRDELPGEIRWSDPDEPEHFPPRNFAIVGDKGKRVLGFGATRDALFVLKEDGVFRVSGTNGEFRIDPVDLTTRCCAPTSIQAINNRIFFLSQKGFVALDDAGVELVARQIAPEVTGVVDQLLATYATDRAYTYATGIAGTACLSAQDERTGEYLFALPNSHKLAPGQVLVLNTETGAATTWSVKPGDVSGLGTDARGAPLIMRATEVLSPYATRIALPGVFEIMGVRADRVTGFSAPAPSTPAPSSPSTHIYVLPGTLTPPPSVGDVLFVGNQAARVLAVESATTVYVDAPLAAGAGVLARPVNVLVEPQGFVQPDLTGKLWTHVSFAVSRLLGASAVDGLVYSATSTFGASVHTVREALQAPELYGVVSLPNGGLLRMVVPAQHRRGYLLRPALAVEIAVGDLRLEAIHVEAREDVPNRMQSHGGAT